jgi:hypothetical protein
MPKARAAALKSVQLDDLLAEAMVCDPIPASNAWRGALGWFIRDQSAFPVAYWASFGY